MKKKTLTALLLRCVRTAFGLAVFALGVHLMIQADVGLAPWDALSMGVSYHTPFGYGAAHTIISIVILGIDLLLRERIGVGTVLDALLVGPYVDLFAATGLLPKQENIYISIGLIVIGLFFLALGQYIYMKAALCCGPRDSFLVGLGKRLPKLPIGAVSILMMAVVLTGGWLLGAPIGVGTLMAVFGEGAVLQLVCRIFRFEPRDVRHEDIFATACSLRG